MNRYRMASLLAGLLPAALAATGPAMAQSGRGGQFAAPLPRMPAGGAGSVPGYSPAQPVAPQVPGVLGDRLPPRYDGLALGHGQFSNQLPPPIPDRPALSPRQYQRGLLSEGEAPGAGLPYGVGAPGGYGNEPGTGYGNVPYGAAPYPVPYAARPPGAAFGSSARIDGE